MEVDRPYVIDGRWSEVSDELARDPGDAASSDQFGEKGFGYCDAAADTRLRGVMFAFANGICAFGYISADIDVSDEDLDKWWNELLQHVQAWHRTGEAGDPVNFSCKNAPAVQLSVHKGCSWCIYGVHKSVL